MAEPERNYVRKKAFDSLSYAKDMESVGFSRQQAEMLAKRQGELIDERLSTKDDLQDIETRLSNRIIDMESRLSNRMIEVETRMEARIESTKADILKWLFSTIGLQTIVIIGAVLGILRFAGH